MARIELRDCIVRFKDGLSGLAIATTPAENDLTFPLTGVVLNTADTDLVPVGARFTILGETVQTVHLVASRIPTSTSPTTDITFTPKLGAGTYTSEAQKTLTFLPQQIEIKIGDGNLTYTENRTYEYMLDRGDLDTVREGDQVPLDVRLECTYEHITTGTSETITPMDALKGIAGAVEWVTSATDQCEPYAIDIEVEHDPSCGTAQAEITLFPDFRADSKEANFQDATISLTGKCNAIEPDVNRES